MISFLADENFNGPMIRGLRRRVPDLDLVTALEAGLGGARDPAVLGWASAHGRVVLTHDVNTMTKAALDRVRSGEVMLGVVAILQGMGMGLAISNLELIAVCSTPEDLLGQIVYVPMR